MSFLLTDSWLRRACAAVVLIALAACAGCMADTAEDSDLPWASNTNWEGMAPIAPSVMNQYD